MFNIIEKRNIFFIISAVIIIAGIVSFFVQGFNTDIDFEGGTEITVDFKGKYDENAIRKTVSSVKGVEVASVQKASANGLNGAIIMVNYINDTQTKDLKAALTNEYKDATISVSSISPKVGQELWQSAVTSIVVVAILMLLYITFRFEVLSGVSAVIALLHDMLVMMSFYTIFRIPVNSAFIAAILTILGYSINATIVIFDRVRENTRFLKKESFSDIMNKSVWQTIARSINTSLTTLFTLVSLYIIGVPSIKDLALPLIIGVICGTYSSVFLAGQFWVLFKGDKKKA